jgi:SAM-dependent methyltransferase
VETADNRVRHYHATTRDFSDESVHQAIRSLGQVYRDMDDPALITNFPMQLHRLRLHASCKTCAVKGNCGGVWQATRESPFERADDLLSRLLNSVSGRVLDVGCGLVPYLEVLKPALENRKLDYLGIDPFELPGDADPLVRLTKTSLEDFDWDGEPFDTVLAIRSLNHLASVNQAIRKLSGLVRAGGRLILAEDTVFGTIRTARKLKMIEDSSSLPFEHRFNLTLEEAIGMLERHGLQVGIKKTPRETSSTLWIVVGYKPGE